MIDEVSDCCGANFYEPGWPDNDMCSACGEHAGLMEEEEEHDCMITYNDPGDEND
tara:strand:- start:72 stop:236 length:165 start_codon:yes stop_codon:yes gene_type:complete